MIKTQDISHGQLSSSGLCSTICIVIEIKYISILQYLQITRLFLSKSDAYLEQLYSVKKEASVVHSASEHTLIDDVNSYVHFLCAYEYLLVVKFGG